MLLAAASHTYVVGLGVLMLNLVEAERAVGSGQAEDWRLWKAAVAHEFIRQPSREGIGVTGSGGDGTAKWEQ